MIEAGAHHILAVKRKVESRGACTRAPSGASRRYSRPPQAHSAHLHRSRLRGCSRSCPCSSSKAALRPHWARRALESASIRARSRWTGCAQRCISALETPPATPTTPPPPARMIIFGTSMRGGAQQWQHSQRINPSSSMQLRQQTCNGTQARRARRALRMSWRVPRREENKWMDKRLWGRGCPYSAVALCQIRVLAVGERVRVEAA